MKLRTLSHHNNGLMHIITNYPLMYLGDSKASTGFDQAQLFNKYFHSVFTHSSYDSPSPDNLPVPNLTLSTVNITPLDVFQALYISRARLLGLTLLVLLF